MCSLVMAVVVGILHVGFFILEAVFWDKPIGMKVFKMTAAQAKETKVLAINQGFYNLFLAGALFYGVFAMDLNVQNAFLTYGFVSVIAAAVVGAWTVSRRILIVQGLPALIGMLCLLLGM